MVDLFAVLAIVFMLHSNEEITVAQAEVQKARSALIWNVKAIWPLRELRLTKKGKEPWRLMSRQPKPRTRSLKS